MRAAISAATAASGQRTAFDSTSRVSPIQVRSWPRPRVRAAPRPAPRCRRPSRSSLRAMAPAATRPIGLARAGAAAALPVADAVLRLGRVIRVRRTVDVLHRLVRRRACVLIADQDPDGRAERPAFEDAGEDLRAVLLLSRRRERALARAPPVEVALDLRHVERRAAAGSRPRPHRRRRRAIRRSSRCGRRDRTRYPCGTPGPTGSSIGLREIVRSGAARHAEKISRRAPSPAISSRVSSTAPSAKASRRT